MVILTLGHPLDRTLILHQLTPFMLVVANLANTKRFCLGIYFAMDIKLIDIWLRLIHFSIS